MATKNETTIETKAKNPTKPPRAPRKGRKSSVPEKHTAVESLDGNRVFPTINTHASFRDLPESERSLLKGCLPPTKTPSRVMPAPEETPPHPHQKFIGNDYVQFAVVINNRNYSFAEAGSLLKELMTYGFGPHYQPTVLPPDSVVDTVMTIHGDPIDHDQVQEIVLSLLAAGFSGVSE